MSKSSKTLNEHGRSARSSKKSVYTDYEINNVSVVVIIQVQIGW